MSVSVEEKHLYLSNRKTGLGHRFMEIIKYRSLLWTLAWRDVRVRYKQSFLGILWAMFVPVSMMLMFSFVFTKIVSVKTDVPYPVFAYCGLLPWQLFSASTTSAANCLVANRSLVTKIYFPTEVFPLSAIMACFVDFLVGSIVLIGLITYFSLAGFAVTISWTAFFVVIIILVQLLFTAGVSFFLSMGNLFFRDVRYIYSVIITLWMFASSVVYPMKVDNPDIQKILNLNPITPILDAYRDVLLRGKLPDFGSFGYAVVISIVIFMAGWIVFFKTQHKFAEKA